MRNCDYYEELISRSLDDELSVGERKELAVHLACCPSCSQMRQLMADISGLMEEDMEELPDGLHEDIMASVRRSEMIRRNSRVGRADKTRGSKKIKISRPVRNLLATAACMALVIAAAVSLNPGDRAESVVMSRSAPETAASAVQQDAAASAAPASTQQPTPTPAPSQAPAAQPVEEASVNTQTVQQENRGSIITTPAPTEDPYLGWRNPSYPETTTTPGSSGQNYTIINPATPSPEPTLAPVPSPELTQAPAADAQAVQSQPQQTDTASGNQETAGGTASAGSEAADGQIQQPEPTAEPEIFTEVHKAAPNRVFSMFPSLAELTPAETVPPQTVENGENTQTDPSAATQAEGNAQAQPGPSPCADNVELDLMDNEKGRDLLLMLLGMKDENGAAPEEAQLPETDCDQSYVIALVFDEIPCELTVVVYGEDVYFSIAEIVIDPLVNANLPDTAVEQPAVTEQPDADSNTGTAVVSNNTGISGDPCDDFEPIWFKAQCSLGDFTAMLDSMTMTE